MKKRYRSRKILFSSICRSAKHTPIEGKLVYESKNVFISDRDEGNCRVRKNCMRISIHTHSTEHRKRFNAISSSAELLCNDLCRYSSSSFSSNLLFLLLRFSWEFVYLVFFLWCRFVLCTVSTRLCLRSRLVLFFVCTENNIPFVSLNATAIDDNLVLQQEIFYFI